MLIIIGVCVTAATILYARHHNSRHNAVDGMPTIPGHQVSVDFSIVGTKYM